MKAAQKIDWNVAVLRQIERVNMLVELRNEYAKQVQDSARNVITIRGLQDILQRIETRLRNERNILSALQLAKMQALESVAAATRARESLARAMI